MGEGSFHRLNNLLNYRGMTYLMQPSEGTESAVAEFMREAPLALNITGPLEKLSYRPDFSEFSRNGAKFFQKEILKRAIAKPIHQLLEKFGKKKAGSVDDSNNGDSPQENNNFSLESLFR